MPYGDLTKQAVQRFADYADLDAADTTIEEREEYEPHIAEGNVVFAGIDYAAILDEAEQEADVILWDGGNNDTPFIKPNLHVVVVDPHRAGHELRYHPGETNLRMAHVCVVNKVDTAPPEESRPCWTQSGRSIPRRRSCWQPRRSSGGERRDGRRQARARRSRTGRRSRTERWPTAPRCSRPKRTAPPSSSIRARSRSARSRRPWRSTRTSPSCSRPWATAASRWTS